jgi:hypothetical protein
MRLNDLTEVRIEDQHWNFIVIADAKCFLERGDITLGQKLLPDDFSQSRMAIEFCVFFQDCLIKECVL